MRWWLLSVALVLMAAGCGGGYEDENRSIISELPAFDGVDLQDEDHYGYCTGDSCPFGNDRNGALLIYSVDVDNYTQDILVEAYREALSGWDATIDEVCANADPSFCDEIVVASFVRDDQRIALNLDNWSVGRFELHVDARGGA